MSTEKPQVDYHETIEVVSNSSVEQQVREIIAKLQQEGQVSPPKKVANPITIGFGSFALCSFVLGLFNAGIITDLPQVAVGVALGNGAIGQLVAAIALLCQGDTFSSTTFMMYSGFFFAYTLMFCSGSGFLEATTANGVHDLNQCMGLIQLAYACVTACYFLGSLRMPIVIRIVLALVFCCYFFGCLGAFTGIVALTKLGGWFSFALAIGSWYIMCAMLYDEEHTWIKLPLF